MRVKLEIIGLSLGGIISLGVASWALTTANIGLAIVMAGPFIASILGFVLLFIGVRRSRGRNSV